MGSGISAADVAGLLEQGRLDLLPALFRADGAPYALLPELLADERIAGEERKKLQDIAAALRVPEIHFGAILEDLAIALAEQRAKG